MHQQRPLVFDGRGNAIESSNSCESFYFDKIIPKESLVSNAANSWSQS